MNEASARSAWKLTLLALPFALLTVVLDTGAREHDTARGALELPTRLGTRVGTDLEVTSRTRALLGTGDVLLRSYRTEGEAEDSTVCLVRMARGTRIHPPEVCYRGFGYEVVRRVVAPVVGPEGTFRANLLRLRKPGTEPVLVLYWYASERGAEHRFLVQQARLALPSWLGGVPDASLVRLTTVVAPEETPEASLERLLELGRDVAAARHAGATDVEFLRHR